jgi:surface antigen
VLARSGQTLKPQAGAARPTSKSGNIKSAKLRVASVAATQTWGGISCVPFARAATGMAVKGNAHAWWDSAAGTYERGQRPEAGSILNFRSTSRMRLGHVAVVARVVDSRTVEIDHANWAGPGGGKGRVARGVPVIDVSEANDWSAVQVGLAGGGFGSVYPTYGFIYDRPDRGMMVANNLARPRAGQPRYTEVAEAWSARTVTVPAATIDAPQRSFR